MTALHTYAQTHGLQNLCRVLFNLSEFTYLDRITQSRFSAGIKPVLFSHPARSGGGIRPLEARQRAQGVLQGLGPVMRQLCLVSAKKIFLFTKL